MKRLTGSVRILKITDERPMLKIVLNMTPGERSFTSHRKVYDLIIELKRNEQADNNKIARSDYLKSQGGIIK